MNNDDNKLNTNSMHGFDIIRKNIYNSTKSLDGQVSGIGRLWINYQ